MKKGFPTVGEVPFLFTRESYLVRSALYAYASQVWKRPSLGVCGAKQHGLVEKLAFITAGCGKHAHEHCLYQVFYCLHNLNIFRLFCLIDDTKIWRFSSLDKHFSIFPLLLFGQSWEFWPNLAIPPLFCPKRQRFYLINQQN